MSLRQQFPQQQRTDSEPEAPRSALRAVGDTHRRPAIGIIHRRVWFLLGIVVFCIMILVALTRVSLIGSGQAPVRQFVSLSKLAKGGIFREYPLPESDSEVMRPAIDEQGRVWFGAMGQNALGVFDPRTLRFQYLTPPHGHHGIMGVQVATDDTIWFAEQYANYLGHYFPATGHYQLYPLPKITVPDPVHAGQIVSLPSAPNELALDMHGDVWFTEFNADSLGRLDPHSGHIRYYPLSTKTSVQTLYPYGITIDPQGFIWFTESGTNQLGRLDPRTGRTVLFSAPDPQDRLMEIASDRDGTIWVTSFTSGLLFRFKPETGTFTSYKAPLSGSKGSALYGLLVTRSGAIWVTILAENVIAHLDVRANHFIYYHIPAPGRLPLGLVMDANQNLWFTSEDTIGMLHPERV